MGKKSGPKAPAAPDPVATANAQSQMNKETAVAQANLNRIDQYTPQGNIRYTQTGVNADGTPKFRQDVSYSPQEQAIYDQQNQISQALNGLAGSNIGRVASTQAQDFNFNGMTPMATSVGAGGISTTAGAGQGVRNNIGPSGNILNSVADAGIVNGNVGNAGNIQKSLNYQNLTDLPGTGDFSADARRVADAVYGQYTSRLDPQFQQQQSDQDAKLAAQGISNNSEAFRREQDNFGRTRNDAYQQANMAAQQAGANEQSRLFGLALGARQQGQNEANTQGQFANSAQQQQFAQNLAGAQFGNEAQAQRYGQNLQSAQFGNEAQDQRFSQNLAGAQFGNEAQNQAFQQGQQQVATNNTAQNQQFNQNLANANLTNAARQQQIQEATYLRNLPLNDIAALMGTAGGVQNPTFQNVSQVGVAAPDYQGAVQNNYNAAMQNYQQQQAARSQMLGSIFGTIGSVGSMAMMSDRRLKHAVERIGTLVSGLPLYVYSYIGDTARHIGVMAQEALAVIPEAVGTIGGYYFVDYRKVF